MPEPKFRYQPENEEETRFKVYADAPGDADGVLYLGIVYETIGSWVADWTGRSAEPIAMPGFKSKEFAASALYWYAPPTQSFGSRPAGKGMPAVDERNIDTSQCGCCVNNFCECEGLNRISQRFGTAQTYDVQPSLIPEHGAVVSLLPMPNGDFLVDLNTRGGGAGIGYLQRRDDGRYDVRLGHRPVGSADSPQTGMWACFKLHTGTKRYEKLTEGFNPYVAIDPWVNGTVTFRGETVEAVEKGVDEVVMGLLEGHQRVTAESSTFSVELRAQNC